jgi:LacI family transcriptional regulator
MHHSTVSRALRNDMSVKEETRAKVMDYAKTNGYQTNMSALELRGNSKNMIAILVPNINHNFFSNVVSIVTNLAFEKGYVVSVFQSNEKYEQEKEIINMLIRNNVSGVIASVSMETSDSDHFLLLNDYHIPLVLFDRICPHIDVPKITVNNFEILDKAVKLLYSKGCKRIAHLSGPVGVNVFHNRQLGYSSAIDELQLDYLCTEVINGNFSIEDGKKAAQKLFNMEIKPDALICDSHLLTLGALFTMKEMSINVPGQVKIIGFSDNPYVEAFNAEVIAIVQPDEAIAQAAFDMIMAKIDNPENEKTEDLTFSAKIVER